MLPLHKTQYKKILALLPRRFLADALIGATTIEHKSTLITANVKHFSVADGLSFEAFEA